MIKGIILILVFVGIAPFLTGFHELGHAAMPLYKGRSALITVGESYIFEFKIKNLEVKIGWMKPWVGYTTTSESNTIWSLLLGPIFSLCVAVLLMLMARFIPSLDSILHACAGWCLFQFFFTIFPMHYPSWLGYQDQFSDGHKIIEMLKK